jgi:protein SCO1/2
MKVQMLRVYEEYKADSTLLLLSHTIDPEYDNVKVLHDYTTRMEVESSKWHFVTGEKAIIYDMAQTSYYVATRENDKAPGGYEHSGAFILVDNQKRIRGVYDGTKAEAVDKLIMDIKTLLIEVNE